LQGKQFVSYVGKLAKEGCDVRKVKIDLTDLARYINLAYLADASFFNWITADYGLHVTLANWPVIPIEVWFASLQIEIGSQSNKKYIKTGTTEFSILANLVAACIADKIGASRVMAYVLKVESNSESIASITYLLSLETKNGWQNRVVRFHSDGSFESLPSVVTVDGRFDEKYTVPKLINHDQQSNFVPMFSVTTYECTHIFVNTMDKRVGLISAVSEIPITIRDLKVLYESKI